MNYLIGGLSIHGNIAVRTMDFMDAGAVCNGHKHNFDHMSLVISGAAEIARLKPDPNGDITIEENGEPIRYSIDRKVVKRAGDLHSFVDVKAGVCHQITALEPSTRVLCIYAHRTPQGDVVEEYNGWPQAYL